MVAYDHDSTIGVKPMNDLTVTTEFLNRNHLLETSIALLQGAIDGLIESDSKQYEVISIVIRYLSAIKCDVAE